MTSGKRIGRANTRHDLLPGAVKRSKWGKEYIAGLPLAVDPTILTTDPMPPPKPQPKPCEIVDFGSEHRYSVLDLDLGVLYLHFCGEQADRPAVKTLAQYASCGTELIIMGYNKYEHQMWETRSGYIMEWTPYYGDVGRGVKVFHARSLGDVDKFKEKWMICQARHV